MSVRGHSAIITNKRDHFNQFQRHTTYAIIMPKATVLSKGIKEAICKVRTFFEMEKKAGKIMITIDKPGERTVANLGVSLRAVDRGYLESQVTGMHINHTVNTYEN